MASETRRPRADGEVVTVCAACAHPWGVHDRIAALFCCTTVAGRFQRGCVCTTRTPTHPLA